MAGYRVPAITRVGATLPLPTVSIWRETFRRARQASESGAQLASQEEK